MEEYQRYHIQKPFEKHVKYSFIYLNQGDWTSEHIKMQLMSIEMKKMDIS